MKKVVIGIVAKPVVEKDMWHYMGIVDEIRYSLIKNNALVIGLLPTDAKLEFKIDEEIDHYKLSEIEKQDLESIIEKLDGVVLEGGLVSNQYEEEIDCYNMKYDYELEYIDGKGNIEIKIHYI